MCPTETTALTVGHFEHMTSAHLLECMRPSRMGTKSHERTFCVKAHDDLVVYLPFLITMGIDIGRVVPMNVTRDTDYTGNGTFFRPFVEGQLDLLLHYYTITMDRWNAGVRYSTPLMELERMFLARSKRKPLIPINLDILLSRLSSLVILIGALLTLATSLSYLAISHYYSLDRNSYDAIWLFARQIIPGNTTGFTHSHPASMKFAVVTVGFLTLCFTAYYQSLLAQSLIVKMHVDSDVLGELMGQLDSGESQVILDHKGALYSMLVGGGSNLKLAKPIKMMENNTSRILTEILDNNAILMHSTEHIMSILNEMPYPECTKYRLATYRPYQQWNAIVLGNDISKSVEQSINVNIILRRDALVRIVEKRGNMSPKCYAHFFPELGSFVGYDELNMEHISGAFVLLFVLLVACTFVFVAEHVYEKMGGDRNTMAAEDVGDGI